MSTPSNQKLPPATAIQDQSFDEQAPATTDKEVGEEAASKVSRRINLLGKLIIPPSPR
jgi:hypothetical protein